MKYVAEEVAKVEAASGLTYPPYYVEPVLHVTQSGVEYGAMGVMYARTIPVETVGGLELWVELSAPLVLYSTKTTLRAVLAHELLHYIEYARRFLRIEVTSDETATTLFEASYADMGRLQDPQLVFNDKRLIRLIKKRFPDGLEDDKLNEKTAARWIEKGLPVRVVPPEGNVVRVPMRLLLNFHIDPLLRLKIDELERVGE